MLPRSYSLGLALIACAIATPAFAELVAADSAFGADTITIDTATDLRWLDVPITSGTSHAEILVETQPGGLYDGYRLATPDELSVLFADAGIDVSAPALGDFVPQNYAPIVALTNLVGVLGDNGICGIGCSFDYTQGWIDAPPTSPLPNFYASASLAWFDNTEGQSPGDPTAPIGRVVLNFDRAEGSDADDAAWLVTPEPEGIALAATASLTLSTLSRVASQRRAARSIRPRPPQQTRHYAGNSA